MVGKVMGTGSYAFFRYIAIAGNVIFVLWMLSNGWDEGWRGTPYQIASYIGLILLLALNTLLLLRKERAARKGTHD
jgi:hypothetical protein